jgi:ribosomal protein S18 acetylase RimI-like enzyme
MRQKLDPSRNPFFEDGRIRLFVAYGRENKPTGRVAAIVNPRHEKMHGEKAGFFGLFESNNDIQTARALIANTFDYLQEAGCDTILGPVNLTTNDESGFLLDGYDERPTFMCNYCPPYYHDLITQCGFQKAVDTLSYMAWHGHPFPEKYYRLVKRIESNPRITIRRFSSQTATDDIMAIADIYNESFKDTWGFIPMSRGEALELGKSLIPIADFDLVWIAYYDDQPAGAILGFPDINEILARLNGRLLPFGVFSLMFGRSKIQGMRVAALGVRSEYRRLGLETLLIHKVHERVHTRPYERSEFSVVMENNLRMRNLLERFGFRLCRRFRLYTRTLGEGI